MDNIYGHVAKFMVRECVGVVVLDTQGLKENEHYVMKFNLKYDLLFDFMLQLILILFNLKTHSAPLLLQFY